MTHIEVEALWQQTERECLGLKDWAKRSHFAALVANAGTEVLREQLAKSCSEDQRHAFGGCPIAHELAARVATLEAAVKAAEDRADQLKDDLDHFMRGDNQ